MSETAIIKIDEAKKALAEAGTLTEITDLRDKAAAVHVYASARGMGELANDAKEMQLRAERRAGEYLANLDRAQGARTDLTSVELKPKLPFSEAIADAGVSSFQAKRWQTAAIVPEERFERYVAETKAGGDELTSTAVYKLGQQYKQKAERQQTKDNIASLVGEGRYRTIVIDPPWPVQKILRNERPNQDVLDYPTMELREIARLPIPELVEYSGCHIYLWVTQKFLPDGFWLFDRWAVSYQCLMTWVKPTGMTPFSWMYNTEHVLFGRVGNLPLSRNGLKLSFEAPATKHSAKPGIFYERVCEASPEPRLELFARQARSGFDVWGNEV